MKKSNIIISSAVTASIILGGLAYMNSKNNQIKQTISNIQNNSNNQNANENINVTSASEPSETAETSTSYPGCQLENPKEGEEIAVVKTNLGNIKIRLFPQQAPKAVENFKSLAKNGYYENVIFHRVIKNFMIQSGDPEGTGMGGESIWKKDFEDEFSKDLLNITGALAMANRGANTNGSQFFINYQDPKQFSGWEYFQNAYGVYKKDPEKFKLKYGKTVDMSKITDDVKKLYTEHGGNPFLDGYYSTSGEGHTVFGQVFDGIETVKKISESKTDSNDKPVDEIKIEKITITPYKTEIKE